jgi:hypothetical protein
MIFRQWMHCGRLARSRSRLTTSLCADVQRSSPINDCTSTPLDLPGAPHPEFGRGNPVRPAIWCGRRRPEVPGGAVPCREIRDSIPGTIGKSRFVAPSCPARHSDMWANRRSEIAGRTVDRMATRLCFLTCPGRSILSSGSSPIRDNRGTRGIQAWPFDHRCSAALRPQAHRKRLRASAYRPSEEGAPRMTTIR